jgi:hypothetical protein
VTLVRDSVTGELSVYEADASRAFSRKENIP